MLLLLHCKAYDRRIKDTIADVMFARTILPYPWVDIMLIKIAMFVHGNRHAMRDIHMSHG